MTTSKHDRSLVDRARECVGNLLDIKERLAEAGKKSRWGRATLDIDGAATTTDKVNDCIRQLKFWIADVRSGNQTQDRETIDCTQDLLDQVQDNTVATQKALERKLTLRSNQRFRLKPTASERRNAADASLTQTLNNVTESIGRLQALTKWLLVDVVKQAMIEGTRNEPGQWRSDFTGYFESIPHKERPHISLGLLNPLWEHIKPRVHHPKRIAKSEVDLDKVVQSWADPRDGTIITRDDIGKATSVLRTLCEAWKQSCPEGPHISMLDILPNMGTICLILDYMKRETLIDDFLGKQHDDSGLTFDKETLDAFLDKGNASRFLAEQYRAVPREWADGQHIVVGRHEPIPLIQNKELGEGSYSRVCQVTNSFFTEQVYARKTLKSVVEGARQHLRREMIRLKELHHRHIVRYIKSYERGPEFGILLKPVATTDLWKLLAYYHEVESPRELLKPILLRSIGCLSNALAYIHNEKVRHKDIKPQNILFQAAQKPGDEAQFLWTDFGLAYDFSKAADSKTHSPTWPSPRYAAPEFKDQAGEEDTIQKESPEHGRASDVFSFGLVLLEILSVVVGDERISESDADASDPDSNPLEFQKCSWTNNPFSKNIPSIQRWILDQESRLESESPIRVLYKAGYDMVQKEEGDRSEVEKIVERLRRSDAENLFFCVHCSESTRQTRDQFKGVSKASSPVKQRSFGRSLRPKQAVGQPRSPRISRQFS